MAPTHSSSPPLDTTPCWMFSPQGVRRRFWKDRELPVPALFLVHRQRQRLCFLRKHHLPGLFPQT